MEASNRFNTTHLNNIPYDILKHMHKCNYNMLSLCNLHLYLKIHSSCRNMVALPWWESEMLKEMPDMMPKSVRKKKIIIVRNTSFISNIIKESLLGKS